MKLTVNGKLIEVDDHITIPALLELFDLHPESIAVEVNFEIIPRFSFPAKTLQDGDQVEIVHFVGGG